MERRPAVGAERRLKRKSKDRDRGRKTKLELPPQKLSYAWFEQANRVRHPPDSLSGPWSTACALCSLPNLQEAPDLLPEKQLEPEDIHIQESVAAFGIEVCHQFGHDEELPSGPRPEQADREGATDA